jgi:hypothetical protein
MQKENFLGRRGGLRISEEGGYMMKKAISH